MIDGKDLSALAQKWLGRNHTKINPHERGVLDGLLHRRSLARNVNETFAGRLTLGQRLADQVALFGGSWTFISCFALFLAGWAAVNSFLLLTHAFDPYPYVFLNLILSMLAAIQAPIIMMSQNRQAARDRLTAEHDYEINLKAEIEIMALHEKLDQLRVEQLGQLMTQQQEQLRLLTQFLAAATPAAYPLK